MSLSPVRDDLERCNLREDDGERSLVDLLRLAETLGGLASCSISEEGEESAIESIAIDEGSNQKNVSI